MPNNNLAVANIARAIAQLQKVLADLGADENPLNGFVRQHLTNTVPAADISCEEIWQMYDEQAEAGFQRPMRRGVFVRQLPAAMMAVFKVRRSTNLRRTSVDQAGKKGRVRGFLGVSRFVTPVLERPDI